MVYMAVCFQTLRYIILINANILFSFSLEIELQRRLLERNTLLPPVVQDRRGRSPERHRRQRLLGHGQARRGQLVVDVDHPRRAPLRQLHAPPRAPRDPLGRGPAAVLSGVRAADGDGRRERDAWPDGRGMLNLILLSE